MKTIALTTALVAALAVPAFADNSGLARSVGVEPGVYTTVELILLRQAIEDQDTVYERFIRRGGAETVSTQSFGMNPGHIALARSLGVDPAVYSTPELILLRQAIEDQDTVYERFLRSSGREVVSTQSFGHNATAMRIFAQLRAESLENE